MPIITFNKKELLKLVGKKLSDRQLEEVISLIKPGVELQTANEITLEVYSDRPDIFGVEGLARAIRSYLGIQPGLKKYKVEKPKLTLKVSKVPIRPFVAAAVVKNVKMTNAFIKSLIGLQEVFHQTFGRKRSKVAIGIHDYSKIKLPISYTAVEKETKMVPLEHKNEFSLQEILEKTQQGKEYGHIIAGARLLPVFMDAEGIFSFPPIINSERTRLTEETTTLFIDLTGTKKDAVLQTLNILVTNLADRGCKIEAVKLLHEKKTEVVPNLTEDVLEISLQQIEKMLGISLSAKQTIELLQRMGYGAVNAGSGRIEVIIPAYRADILHPVDIIEDVAYAYGLNNFSPKLPNVATVGKANAIEKISEKICDLLVGFGFQEVMRFTLSNQNEQFTKMGLPKGDAVEIENPVSAESTCLRVWLIPSLLKVLSANKHVEYPQNIFEIGDVVLLNEKAETMTENRRRVAGVICASRVSFAETKSIVDTLLKNLGLGYHLRAAEHKSFIEGRAAEIFVNGKKVGIFGEIHPQILENWNLEMPVAAFEIEIENLF
jgi:phenylalanyl-tRNA synthetase beta chain